MPLRELVEEFEKRKKAGGFDEQIYEEINLTLKLSDRDIDDIDLESSKVKTQELFNVTFFEHLKRRYPDLF